MAFFVFTWRNSFLVGYIGLFACWLFLLIVQVLMNSAHEGKFGNFQQANDTIIISKYFQKKASIFVPA